ncbi:S8 family serine peptidase [Tenacibaculum sp. ZS6-P6]|uniref:S8 family serine peptidase n=1 Tax=Tenacibaculum sp. ZS6-P6 TaxID=3447503 RepID=UPI003F98E765
MKNICYAFCMLFVVYSGISQQNDINKNNSTSQKRLIVKFKNSGVKSKSQVFSKLNKTLNVTRIESIHNLNETFLLKLNSNKNYNKIISEYQNTGLFEYVEIDPIGEGHGKAILAPNEPLFNRQWSLVNDGSFSLSPSIPDADIDMDLAWEITTGDSNIIVAILDSGIKTDHPEFLNRFWINEDEIPGDFIDNDNNGYVDDHKIGWDFVENNNSPNDHHGHGTNVAGIAVATGNNNIGYAGVNWNCKIMACRVLDRENLGFYSNWAKAIIYSVNNGAHVINLSAGGIEPSNVLKEAIDYAYSKNVPVIVSAGNKNTSVEYPARYEKAIAVGATNSSDRIARPFSWSSTSGSNYGPQIDFVAPGNYIYGLNNASDTNYNYYWSGTSQAAPHVAGLISLMLSLNKDLTIDEINTVLRNTSEDKVGGNSDLPGKDDFFGYGRINAYEALKSNMVLSTEGMNEIIKNDFVIYPNPYKSGDDLFINNKLNNKFNAKVYNTLGQMVFEINTNKATEPYKISGLESGTYFVKISNIENHSKIIINKKLIIK